MSTSGSGAGLPPNDPIDHPARGSGKARDSDDFQQSRHAVGGVARQAPSPCAKCRKCTAPSAQGPVEQSAKELEAAAERDLFRLLHAQGVQGPVWASVVTTLSEYATQVLNPWIWTNEIYKQLRGKGLELEAGHAERRALTVDRDFRMEIVNRTIVAALAKFQERMRQSKGWDPCQGSRLKTYFINACLFEFPAIVEKDLRWQRAHQFAIAYDDFAALADAQALSGYRTGRDPISAATDRLELEAYLMTLSDIDRIIVTRVAEGYKHKEIAELFPGITPKAVERRLDRIRKHARLDLRTHE